MAPRAAEERCERGAAAQFGVEGRLVRHGVVKKDQEECEEAEDVEFGMIEALIRQAGGDWVRGHWAIPDTERFGYGSRSEGFQGCRPETNGHHPPSKEARLLGDSP